MNRNPDVDAWFERYDNPLKDLVQEVREAVLAAKRAALGAVIASWIEGKDGS